MMTDYERHELLLKAKPILFNMEMVRAILDGRKTAARRVVKFLGKRNPNWTGYVNDGLNIYNGTNEVCNKKPPYKVGDILYVRETWAKPYGGMYRYRADYNEHDIVPADRGDLSVSANLIKWHPSIHMPREAARIFLQVTNVRVERLQDITPEQIDAEGCKEYAYNAKTGELLPSKPTWFKIKWGSTIKKSDIDKYGWAANPWVWVIEFERIDLR